MIRLEPNNMHISTLRRIVLIYKPTLLFVQSLDLNGYVLSNGENNFIFNKHFFDIDLTFK